MDLFLCEKTHCRLTKRACAKRYATLRQQTKGWRGGLKVAFISTDECLECEIGAKHEREVMGTPSLAEKIASETIKDMGVFKTITKTKMCSKCNKSLPLAAFHKQTASPDGRKYSCKDCLSAINGHKRRKKYLQEVDQSVKVDFSIVPGLFEKLAAEAENEVRTIEGQVLFVLKGVVG